jgi:hypothetical protein
MLLILKSINELLKSYIISDNEKKNLLLSLNLNYDDLLKATNNNNNFHSISNFFNQSPSINTLVFHINNCRSSLEKEMFDDCLEKTKKLVFYYYYSHFSFSSFFYSHLLVIFSSQIFLKHVYVFVLQPFSILKGKLSYSSFAHKLLL